MKPVYIRATGLYAEHCVDQQQLAQHLATRPALPAPALYQAANVRLVKSELAVIAREDRSILNDLATGILNATSDLLSQAAVRGLDAPEDMPLYAGTDGVAEYSFTALSQLIEKLGTPQATLQNLGQLSGMTNPINMMRFLSTNPVYHLSKRLALRGGGYPIRGMSLSGLYALEDAVAELQAGRSQQALVCAAGSMRNFDSLVVFGKLGLLDPENPAANLHPSYGTALLWLDSTRADDALAELQWVQSCYSPEPFPQRHDWLQLLEQAAKRVTPDVVVSYCNGVKANDENETSVIQALFPEAQICNYKSLFGYTSKANNLLDIVAMLADPSIKPGSTVLVNGAGFGVGIGYVVVKKLRHSPVHSTTGDAA